MTESQSLKCFRDEQGKKPYGLIQVKRAGIRAKKNGWRHSFPSHLAARDQSAELAAYLLQHKNANYSTKSILVMPPDGMVGCISRLFKRNILVATRVSVNLKKYAGLKIKMNLIKIAQPQKLNPENDSAI